MLILLKRECLPIVLNYIHDEDFEFEEKGIVYDLIELESTEITGEIHKNDFKLNICYDFDKEIVNKNEKGILMKTINYLLKSSTDDDTKYWLKVTIEQFIRGNNPFF